MKTIFIIFSIIISAIFVNAQIEPDLIPKDKNLISVPVTVSDREGRYIPDLKKDDFSLYENGVRRRRWRSGARPRSPRSPRAE